MDLKNSKISSGVFPQAYYAPTIDPALVPAICVGLMFFSSRYLMTPACAKPFDPPPESTSPIDFVCKSIL